MEAYGSSQLSFCDFHDQNQRRICQIGYAELARTCEKLLELKSLSGLFKLGKYKENLQPQI